MTIKSIVSINGKLFDREAAKVSVFDRGFLFGDSVYEVTLTHNQKIFLLDDHLDRLWLSAEKLGIEIEWTREKFLVEIEKCIQHLGLPRVYIRIVVTRGEGEIGLDPALGISNNHVLIVKELPENPKNWYAQGVHMIVADIQRTSKKAMDPGVKSGNYLNNVMAIKEAKERGAFDAIMLNYKGHVTEATTSNIYIVKDQKVLTPPLQAGLLEGITRKTLIDLGQRNHLTIHQEDFSAGELRMADEAFLTSSTKGIVPITKIDETAIGSGKVGPLTTQLSEIYQNFVLSHS